MDSRPSYYGLALHTTSPDLGLAISNFAGDSRQQHWSLGRDTSNLLHSYLLEFLQPQTWQNLRFAAVAKGPGGFTGTRIGVVATRTLAQQLEIPLFTISTLAALAWTKGLAFGASIDIAVEMPAQRGDVFGAMYHIDFPNSPEPYQREQGQISTAIPLHLQQYSDEYATLADSFSPPNAPDLEDFDSVSPQNWEGRGVKTAVTPLLPDAVFSPDDWQQTLENWQEPYHLVHAEEGLGASVTGVLELAYLDWQQGKRPHWSEAMPFYGQHPVQS